MVEEERIGLRGRIGRVLFFLIIMLLLAIVIAAQLGLRASRPSVVDARIFPLSTADYGPWDLISIRRVDPLVGTLIAQDFLATSSPASQVAMVPTDTDTPARELPTLAPSLTPSLSPVPTLTQTPSNTAITAPSITPVDTQVPPPTATDTPVPSATSTASPAPTNTATGVPPPTLTRTPIATATTQVIIPAPNASFSYTQVTGTAPFQVNFTSTSSGSITSYLWNFGDGTTSTQANPGHSYGTSGTYSVSLTVTGPGGASTSSQTITVVQTPTAVPIPTATPVPPIVPPPVANFSWVQATNAIRRINFTNQSSGNITSVNWTFGDGNPGSTQFSPSHTYGAAGTYNVTLAVSGPGGTNAITRAVTVYDRPTASFTYSPSSPLTGQTVAFSNTSSGTITSQLWEFGDGATSSALNPTHIYTAANTYTVRLTVTGPGGTTTSSQFIIVSAAIPPPVADFTATPTTALVGQTVSFTDISTGTITGWLWDFGDGNSSTAQNPTHAYSAPGSYTVRLTVTGPGGTNSRPRTVTVVVPTADLSVSIAVDNANPLPGTSVQFTVTATNNGPTNATGVSVQTNITLSAADQVTYASDSGTNFNPASGLWTIGALNSSASQTIVITAQVSPAIGSPSVTKTATVSATSPADPNNANNSASQTLTIGAADLAITKAVNNATPLEGQTITFTLTVTNNGPNTDSGVSVTDTLPAGLTYISDDSGGTYNSGTGVWTIGSLASSVSASLQISASVDGGTAGTTITNTATVSGTMLDLNATNNTSSASITVGTGADLALTKTVNNPFPQPGDNVTFTVTLTNNGPNTATGIEVTDVLPADLTFVSAVPGGQYNAASGIWTVQPTAAGNSRSLMITAQVNPAAAPGTTITNTATITASSVADPNTANDTASVTIRVPIADLSLTMTVDNATPLPGETITLTVTVANAGPDDATNVSVGVQSFPLIASGGSETFTVDIPIDLYAPPGAPPNPFDFIAEITASDAFDPDSTPNNNIPTEDDYDSVSINIQPAADLAVSISADNTSPASGGAVTLTIAVDNLGPVDATGVTVDVPLPAGLTYVSDDGGTAYNSATGVWTVGNVAVSAGPISLNIVADVTASSGSPIDVTSDVSGSPTDQNPPNDTDTVTLTIP